MNDHCFLPWKFLAGGLTALFCLTACVSPYNDPRLANGTTPPDFSLVFHVQGPVDAHDPLEQTSQTVLECNRTLRVVVGPGATEDYWPAVTRRLEPAEFDQVYQLLAATGWSTPKAGAPVPQPSANPPVLYQITVTMHAHTHHLVTTPDQAPGWRAVLHRLVELRKYPGGKTS